MVKVRGVAVFPSNVEFVLGDFQKLTGNCQIVVDKRTPSQEVALKVETIKRLSLHEKKMLKAQIVSQVKNRVGVTVNDLMFVSKGAFESKYQKTITLE